MFLTSISFLCKVDDKYIIPREVFPILLHFRKQPDWRFTEQGITFANIKGNSDHLPDSIVTDMLLHQLKKCPHHYYMLVWKRKVARATEVDKVDIWPNAMQFSFFSVAGLILILILHISLLSNGKFFLGLANCDHIIWVTRVSSWCHLGWLCHLISHKQKLCPSKGQCVTFSWQKLEALLQNFRNLCFNVVTTETSGCIVPCGLHFASSITELLTSWYSVVQVTESNRELFCFLSL